MQKGIGLGMILLGCIGLGLWYSTQYQRQLKDLREMCRVLELFLGEIRFGRSTLPECCFHLSDRTEEPYKSCFQEIYNASCKNLGESFGELCQEKLEKALEPLAAKQEDKERFLSCFRQNGFAEDRMQLRVLEQTKEELEGRLELLGKETESRCKLALSLGTMSGLLLVILFV